MAASRPSFLIVRIAALGDIAVATPLLNRIRDDHPDARVAWLCGASGAELVRLFPGVDDVIAVDEVALLRGGPVRRLAAIAGVWRRLATRRFQTAFVLHADRRYRLLLLPLRGTRIVSAHHGPGPGANPIPARFRGDEAARLMDGGTSTGPLTKRWALADVRDRLPLPAASASGAGGESTHRVVLVPGGARNVLRDDALRRWPVDSYVSLARRLVAAGVHVTLIGDRNDVEIGRRFDGVRVENLIGALSLTETLRVLRDASLVVSHDTGPLHLARLVRTPIVALFGPTDPAQVVGVDPAITAIWGGDDLPCRPCYDGRSYANCSNNICINRVSVDAVMTTIQLRLANQVTVS
jgi:heptosyltransferase II